jgi:hypothetical protein
VYSRRIHAEMQDEIVEQIQAMANNYTSLEFYTALEINHPQRCEALILSYMQRGHDRPHATQIFHSQLMHTVSHSFSQLTRKVATIGNPKGGDMSQWVRL